MEKGYPKVVWLFVFVCVQKGGRAAPQPGSPAPPRTRALIGRRRLLAAPPASTRAAPEAWSRGASGGRPTPDRVRGLQAVVLRHPLRPVRWIFFPRLNEEAPLAIQR